MELTGQQQLLIDTLKAYPSGTIYTDSSRKTVFKGFKLYNDRSVEKIFWHDDRGVLGVNLTSPTGKTYPVTVSIEGESLAFHCGCDGLNRGEKCEHIVCALATLVHLLKPTLFKMGGDDPHHRDRLLAGLMKTRLPAVAEPTSSGILRLPTEIQKSGNGLKDGTRVRGKPLFRIVLEESGKALKAHIEQDGERIEPSRQARSLKSELLYLLSLFNQDNLSLPQPVFLRKWTADYPILYRDRTGDRPVEWMEKETSRAWMEFDVSGDSVVLSKRCAIGDGLIPAELVGYFAFSREQAKICLSKAETGRGWKLWRMIRAACLREPSAAARVIKMDPETIRVPRNIFENFQIMLSSPTREESGGSIVYKVEGLGVNPVATEVSGYRLTITEKRSDGSEFLIRPECRAGNYAFLPSQKILSFVKAMEFGRVPASLRTKKRKPILFDAFFEALALNDREARDEALKKIVNDTAFGRHKLAALARRLIRGSIEEWKNGGMQLRLMDGRWHLMSPDKEKEALLFLVPYRVFGSRLFEKIVPKSAEMTVERDDLLKGLGVLRDTTRKHDIELCFNGLPVERARWELELDATDGTIDWFEIRPEIRCNGQILEKEVWEQALAGQGVIYHNGAVQILDETTVNTLAVISGLSGAGQSSPREVVTVPRHRILELLSLRRQGIRVKLSPRDEEIIGHLMQFESISGRPVPGCIKSELRDYQKKGYYWLSFLYEHRFGACLADDMGLGKTVQAISFLGAIKEGRVASPFLSPVPSLVVVPPSLIFNWEQEIERFCPALRVYVYQGRERSAAPDGYDVVITSYGLVRKDIKKLKNFRFNVIIFDEAQTIKNIFAHTTGAARQLNGFFKVALTGTPMENHIGEYYSIMDLILPGLLGEHKAFQARTRQEATSLIPFITERTRPFVLRRTKERILKELPPKIERDVYLELTETQKRFYNKTVAEVRSTIDDAYRSKTAAQAKIIALTAIMKLRQICLTPKLVAPGLEGISPKVEFLVDKLGELSSEAHCSLVFSQFTSFLNLVEEELRFRGHRIFRLDGSTPVAKRKGIVEGFQRDESTAVFLLSLKAGGQGLNLARAAYVFHLDPWWNPAVETQASDRSHRIGQKDKVIVTRLIMRHTVEEKMMTLKQRKLMLYRALMDAPEESAGRSITREDFNFLLGAAG